MSRALRGKRKPLPPIQGSAGMVFTDEEKAEAFAESLELQCRPSNRYADADFIESVHREVLKYPNLDPVESIPFVSPAEVQGVIRGLKIRKAPGPDGVPNRALKNLPRKPVVALTGIINAMLRFGHFPSRWKTADVIFIHKPGKDPKVPQNHRPISLLSSVGKVAERIIKDRLFDYVRDKNVIPDEQFGFRPNHSTTDQLLRLVEYISFSNVFHKVTGAVFLDISKAFDTVWHEGLVYKLKHAGIPVSMVQLIRSFLDSRSFRAKIGDTLSESHPIEAGVPQGSVLSPLLYAVYTADIPSTVRTQLGLYADDTSVVARSSRPYTATRYLQAALTEIETWCSRWRIDVNPDKSKAILFSRRRGRNPHGRVRMFGRDIPWVNQVTYLGVILDRQLSFRPHACHALARAKAAAGRLSSLLCRKSSLSFSNKLLLYKSIVRPTLTYASPAWAFALKKKMRERLETVQNKILRSAFKAPWFVRNNQLRREASLPLVRVFLRETAKKAFSRAEQHPNPLVRSAVDYDAEGPSKAKRPKMSLLDVDDEQV